MSRWDFWLCVLGGALFGYWFFLLWDEAEAWERAVAWQVAR